MSESPAIAELSGGEPVARIGRHFLPVAASVLPPLRSGADLLDLAVSPGTPVHAMEPGRVVAGDASGEIVLYVDGGVRLHYRGLLPTSVRMGDYPAEAGDVVGVVASGAAGDLAALRLGAQGPDNSWISVAELLVGRADPAEQFLIPTTASADEPPAPARDAPVADQPTSDREGRVRRLTGRSRRPGESR